MSQIVKKRPQHRLKVALAISLLFFIAFFYVIPRMGCYLVRQDKLLKADAIVILMGNIPDRTLAAFDLYKKGYAKQIIIVMANRYGIDFFRNKGIPLDGQTTITKKALIGLGVPAKNIITLPGDAKSTKEEAVAIKKYVALHRQTDTILLVSSSYHTRRATLIFNKELKELNEPITVISCPSKYTGFKDKYWWKDRESAKIVFYEYLKLVNTLLF